MQAGGRNNRVVLMELPDLYREAYYYYADDLPCASRMYTVLSVIGSILATPLILLCCIPTIKSIKKTQKLVEEGDIEAARNEFRISFLCRMGAWMWGAFVAPLLLTALTLVIVFGAVGRLG